MDDEEFLKALKIGGPDNKVTWDDVGAFFTIVASIGFVFLMVRVLWAIGSCR